MRKLPKRAFRLLLALAFLAVICPLASLATKPVRAALPKLVLTETEKQWIKDHPVIRVGGPKAFPPFHYYDQEGRVRGIGPEELEILAQKLGLEIEYQKAMPWPEVLQKIKTGQLDLLGCTAKSPAREEFLSFSKPYLSMPMVIITRKESAFVGGLEDLNSKKVALVKRVVTAKWLERDGIWVEPVWVNTPLEALTAVYKGRAEACIENLAAASFLIQNHGLLTLKVAAPTGWGEYKLHFAARKDWPVLSLLLDKALSTVLPEKLTAIRNKYIAVRYEHGLQAKDVVRWVAIVGIPLAFLALFFLYHNRRLKREVAERIKAQKETSRVNKILQDALAEVKQLSGLLPICSGCKSIRDDKGYWREVEQYVTEHTDARFSHGLCPDCTRRLYPDLAEKVLKASVITARDKH